MAQRAREGAGPALIEAFTYRMGAHTTSDDPTRYRLDSDVEAWRLRDPLERVRSYLHKQQLVDAQFFADLDAEAEQLAVRLRDGVRSMPDPAPGALFENAYAEPHSLVDMQHREFTEYLAGFATESA
jgi:pyruvate dehydrogenase E1 component alpha subunit